MIIIYSYIHKIHTINTGAFILPVSYTLSRVTRVNGSNSDAGCPEECVGVASGIKRCDCTGTPMDGSITGALIDDTIPVLDPQQISTWAAQLYTARRSFHNYITVEFRFQNLVQMELYILHCPAWYIGADIITVHRAITYPHFYRVFDSIGNVTLNRNVQNCESFTIESPFHCCLSQLLSIATSLSLLV